MTKNEYVDYESRVESFFEREGITNLSCIIIGEEACEPHFSTWPCDCCKRHWHGDRHDCNGYNPTTKEIYEFRICEDCVYYAEYGRLDDTTMMDLEDDNADLSH